MNNSGPSPLKVPGFGGLPINHELDPAECFNDGGTAWRQRPRLTARELAMIALMDSITDIHNWEVDVFDEEKVLRWRVEACDIAPTITFEEHLVLGWGEKTVPAMPLISDKTWIWCLSELRDKARALKSKGFVRAVDAGSCICKSDKLISTALADELKHAVAPLREEYGDRYSSDDQMADLVDPNLFPLIYGKTQVYTDGTQVGREDCVESCSDTLTATAPVHPENRLTPSQRNLNIQETGLPFVGREDSFRWSLLFQWLPCELKFNPEGGTGVSITTYINNLHPIKYKPLYEIIEKIMAPTIELWNDCLFKGKTGPAPIRIRTYGYEEGQPPEWLENIYTTMNNFWKNGEPPNEDNARDYEEFLSKMNSFLDLPDHARDDGMNSIPEELKQEIASRDRTLGWRSCSTEWTLCSLVEKKIRCLYGAAHPEPGTAFSYEDWRAGRNGKAIIAESNKEIWQENRERPQKPDPNDGVYKVALQDEFRAQGLQIIIRIRDIELTPAQPTFISELTLEAQRNEHIVATAAYIYSSENINQAKIAFRQATLMDGVSYDFKEDSEASWSEPQTIFPSMRAVFAFSESADVGITDVDRCEIPGIQSVGSVSLPPGRLLTWPNTLHHRLEPLSLLDNERPGHLRMLLVYLIDPHYRIASTANVPPQQHEWWSQVALDGVFAGPLGERVPWDIRQMIDEETEEWPMGKAEAENVRVEAERERAQALKAMGDYGTWYDIYSWAWY